MPGLWGHNCGSIYARKPFKGSKDSDGSLVSKKTCAKKLAHLIGAQGRVNLAKKTQQHPPFVMPPIAPQTKNWIFFQSD